MTSLAWSGFRATMTTDRMNPADTSRPRVDLREPLQRETVASVGYRDLVACEIDATLAEALHVMQEKSVGCLVVLEGGTLRGIFTERDVVTRVLGKVDSLEVPLSDYMTPDPSTARLDEPIHLILARMNQGGMRHLPVLDTSDRPVGTISVKRAVHFLADHFPEAIRNLDPDPGRYPGTPEGG